MPRVQTVIYACDYPDCGTRQDVTRYVVTKDQVGSAEVFLCVNHSTGVEDALRLGQPVNVPRQARRHGLNRDRLESLVRD